MNNRQGIQIDVRNLDDVQCPECTGTKFSPLIRLKKLPRLLSPDGTPGTVNVQEGYTCLSCGKELTIQEIMNSMLLLEAVVLDKKEETGG